MTKNRSILGELAKNQLINRFRNKKHDGDDRVSVATLSRIAPNDTIPESYCRFDKYAAYENMLISKTAADRFGITNPFFKVHDGIAGPTTTITGQTYINFSSYNYLGLSDHPDVIEAAKQAIDQYGTSVSASRLVAGERPIHRSLENALASLYGVEDCLTFVSGHATNVSTIGYLFGPKDLIIHDSLIHNSVLEGIKLSGSARRSFPHNNLPALEAILAEIRHQFERVLVVVEGHYSMDGDIADLPELIQIKKRHKAFLMVDEAHSLGVLGKTGKGLHEHCHLPGSEVDIWMGTLSKTLVGCGGYIAGSHALVEHLKYAAPGFVYSVGMPPALAAASLTALHILENESNRVETLHQQTTLFLTLAQNARLDTGESEGYAIVPIIIGSSLKATKISGQLFDQGINVQPIIYPAVEESAARLRFFISSQHTKEHIEQTIAALKELL